MGPGTSLGTSGGTRRTDHGAARACGKDDRGLEAKTRTIQKAGVASTGRARCSERSSATTMGIEGWEGLSRPTPPRTLPGARHDHRPSATRRMNPDVHSITGL